MDPRVISRVSAEGIGTLTLNHPERNNAFDDGMIADMVVALDAFIADPAVRIVVLAATGKHFSAGANLTWMQRMADASLEENLADAAMLARLMNTIWECPKPVVARVQGAAYGGAVGLIACADIALATETARFCLSEVKLGLAPAVISPYVTRALGGRAAGRYLLSAEEFNATTARDLGLVHEVVADENLDTRVDAMLAQLLRNGPAAMAATKALLRRVQTPIDRDTIDHTTQVIARLRVSPEGQEGMSAFFAKRAPQWPLQGTHS